jgi:RNA-splicing ligase RtcB
MKRALNLSFANRQIILHRIREVFEGVFGRSAQDLGMHMVYDAAHNTAKLERHIVDSQERTVLVHRKGATRAFGPGHPELPEAYRDVGQPVIIGGSMETGSYLLIGTPEGAQTLGVIAIEIEKITYQTSNAAIKTFLRPFIQTSLAVILLWPEHWQLTIPIM